MAALVAGVQYGLSSHSNFHENKSLIFVKLTDSAQRAIEDYLRNRNEINQNPTIQFLGNEGQLSFPSIKSNYGNFTFSLSSNQDIEGPQGGFECVQQIGSKNLESLGALPCKMRIQATDDVYETTRHRMHVAEENNKNKCTRVIKANEPIGRKVKVKGTIRATPPPGPINSNINLKHREPASFSFATIQSTRLTSSYKVNCSSAGSSRTQLETHKKLPEIMRRPLKERLIHLLALRPFKRPELYDRINREGVREKEKHIITTILKQIAFMRDNTYHLHRCMWNDVQEDWPFYTEQEKAMLKRRKPQNLTPPGSSDGGSSGSGQSPNSTHPGSPPAITAPPPGLLSSKRPGYYQGNDGLPTKRQRISHYRKSDHSYLNSLGDSKKITTTNNIMNHWDQKQQQRKSRHQQHQQPQPQQQNNCESAIKSDLTPTSDNEELNTDLALALNKSNSSNNLFATNRVNYNFQCNSDPNDHYYQQYQQQQQEEQPQLCNTSFKKVTKNKKDNLTNIVESISINSEDNFNPVQVFKERNNKDDKDFRNKNKERLSESKNSMESSSGSKISNHEESNTEDVFLTFSDSSKNFHNSEYPDYLTYYKTISSSEQRTRYKAEFNAYYKEYRKLHVQVVEISKQFSQLEEMLRERSDSGNMEGYEAIKNQILQEYARTKNINARFYYLHDKLGHIKKLVSEYDAQVQVSSSLCSNNNQCLSSSDLDSDGFHHDFKENLTQPSTEQPITCPSKITHTS